jgi:3(or 17)beta-hydroxysteroid dehydrogenase
MARLDGKVSIITGGASGIGAATAERFVKEGAKVAITDRNVGLGKKLAEHLGNSALFIEHDVTSENEWQNVVASTVETFGHLNILVNCAGYGIHTTIENTTYAQWREMFAVHADGAFFGCKYSFPEMLKSGSGSIVNVSSSAAMFGKPSPMPYAAAKASLEGLTRSIAAHSRSLRYPIRCNCVMPGAVDTPLIREGIAGFGNDIKSPEMTTYFANNMGRPDDVAGAILFLASDDACFVNSQFLIVDGGKNHSAAFHPGEEAAVRKTASVSASGSRQTP